MFTFFPVRKGKETRGWEWIQVARPGHVARRVHADADADANEVGEADVDADAVAR